MVTDAEVSGSPPKRAPPPVPAFTQPRVFAPAPVLSPPPDLTPPIDDDDSSSHVVSHVSKSHSFDSAQVHDLTVDDIEDFEDDDDVEEDNIRMSRRNWNDATDLAVGLPSFVTGILSID